MTPERQGLLEKTDEVEQILVRVRASLDATAYLMGDERSSEPGLDDVQLWLGDLATRVNQALKIVGELRVL